jgi:hypothetical protein
MQRKVWFLKKPHGRFQVLRVVLISYITTLKMLSIMRFSFFKAGNVYENLQSKLSYILDQSVNNQVAKKLLEDTVVDTKTDLVLDTISEGIITLLRKYPDQKHKLHVFFNQPIPQPLRFTAWQLYFSNTKRNFFTYSVPYLYLV